MDPVCHTLVGASLAATGLGRRTRFGCATLVVAANLPDVDAVLYFWNDARAYAFRRGITHGLPAVVLLPVLLALAMSLLGRLRPATATGAGTSLRWLVILSLIGVASHPALDWLNNYGMRWLMPISDRWFYGDALFIFDPLVWAILAAGLLAARFRATRRSALKLRPAAVSLVLVVAYIVASLGLTGVARREAVAHASELAPMRVMASPVALHPLTREILIDTGRDYRFGRVSFSPLPTVEWLDTVVAKGDPALLDRARQFPDGRWFLRWARFPYATPDSSGTPGSVRLGDARYVRDLDAPRLRSFGAIDVGP
jgi:inner membrane protein